MAVPGCCTPAEHIRGDGAVSRFWRDIYSALTNAHPFSGRACITGRSATIACLARRDAGVYYCTYDDNTRRGVIWHGVCLLNDDISPPPSSLTRSSVLHFFRHDNVCRHHYSTCNGGIY